MTYFKVILVSLFLISCAHSDHSSFSVNKESTVSGFSYYNVQDRVLLAGLPSDADLKNLKSKGVDRVIDLRSDREVGDGEFGKTVTAKGMEYNHYAFLKGNKIDLEKAKELDALLAANPKELVLIHCASSARAASWLAVHMNKSHGYSVDEAMNFARKAGLTNKKLDTLTLDTLKQK